MWKDWANDGNGKVNFLIVEEAKYYPVKQYKYIESLNWNGMILWRIISTWWQKLLGRFFSETSVCKNI